MAEILSLSKARKAKAKIEKENLAETNRIKFGRTKAERDLVEAKKLLSDKKIDAHKREE
jgi:hypothetical protein